MSFKLAVVCGKPKPKSRTLESVVFDARLLARRDPMSFWT
jgi:hypothetical protein